MAYGTSRYRVCALVRYGGRLHGVHRDLGPNGILVTWTDTPGVTHEVVVPYESGLRPGTCSRRWNPRLRCGRFGPIGAKDSAREPNCMACVVAETR